MVCQQDVGSEVGWIVLSHIGWGEEQNIILKSFEGKLESLSKLKEDNIY